MSRSSACLTFPLVVVAVAATLGGCPPALRFRVVEDRDGSVRPGADAGPGRDGSVQPGADAARPGECADPQLLVSVEDLGPGAHGRVLRFEIGDALPLTPCTDLTGGGTLLAQPMAVSAVGNQVVIAAPDGVQAINPASDTVAWEAPQTSSEMLPAAVFPLRTPEGMTVAAVGWDYAGEEVSQLVTYHAGVADVPQPLNATGGPGAGVEAVTASPFNPGKVLYVKSSMNIAAREWDPFANVLATDTYAPYPTSGPVQSIAAVDEGSLDRIAWASNDGSIFYLNDSTGADGTPPAPLRRCDCSDIVDVVPDPTLSGNYRFYALCARSGVIRDVVRFASTSTTCDVLLDGSTVPGYTRLSGLAVTVGAP